MSYGCFLLVSYQLKMTWVLEYNYGPCVQTIETRIPFRVLSLQCHVQLDRIRQTAPLPCAYCTCAYAWPPHSLTCAYLVRRQGHLVPMDQPAAAQNMIKRFVRGFVRDLVPGTPRPY